MLNERLINHEALDCPDAKKPGVCLVRAVFLFVAKVRITLIGQAW